MLGVLGGLSSLGLVWVLTRVVPGPMLGAITGGLSSETDRVQIDWRVALFALVLSVVVGVVFSVLPAIRAMRVDLAPTLRALSVTATRSGVGIGAALTVLQLAASLTLVVGALLLAATLRHLTTVPLGFDPSNVSAVRVSPENLGYGEPEAADYYRAFVERLQALPEVERTGVGSTVPLRGSSFIIHIGLPGQLSTDTEPRAHLVQIFSTGYFDTLGISVVRGRVFRPEEIVLPGREAARVVVLGRAMAEDLFGTVDVVGRPVELSTGGLGGAFDVIGVVADVRYEGLVGEPEPIVYLPSDYRGRIDTRATIVVRAAPTLEIADAVQAVATSLNDALPVGGVAFLSDTTRRARASWVLLTRLMTTLAVVAGALAGVGLYSVVMFSVSIRRRELGIRMALGATPRRVLALVGRQTAFVTAGALLLGVAGARALARVLESRLVGVTPLDPSVWTLAGAMLLAVILLAAWGPTRRAMRLDVSETLRVL